MIFLDPTNDLVFKKLFGNSAHKNIVISFLNSILQRPEEEKIVDVVFNDPHNIPEITQAKHSIVDIRCTDQKGFHYIVEMQVIKQKDYAERCQYYSALALGRQLKAGQKYHSLVPVIFVGILCFDLFKSTNYVSHHLILDTVTGEHALKHFEFHFIELTKFEKKIDEATTILDKWIYLLKYADTMNTVPSTFKKETDVQEAFDILEQGSWSKAELEAYDRYLDAIRSSASQLETALEEGELKGELKRARLIAKKLLTIHDNDTIAQITGLTLEDVQKLRK
jgi:predicted transposase/invertase (TIGR01784 family)